eukprot:gene13299-14672_t
MNEEDKAVIGVDRKGFSCTRCTFGKHTCRHINMLNAELDGEQAAIPDCLVDFVQQSEILQNQHRKLYTKKALSTAKISLVTQPLQKSVHEGTLLHAAKDGVDGSLLLIPDFDDEECNICGTNYDFNFLWKCGVKLVTRSCVRLVHVPERKCPNCKHVQNFYGSARGLLNMGEFVIGHDVLKDYMFRFLTGNSFENRTLVPEKKIRDLLKEYATMGMDKQSLSTLRSDLASENVSLGVLADFLSWCEDSYETWHSIPTAVRDMVLCFATTSPICGYFPPSRDVFAHISSVAASKTAIGDNMDAMLHIQKYTPIIVDALTAIHSCTLPQAWYELFKFCQEKAEASLRQKEHELKRTVTKFNKLSYFPNWPVKCLRGKYAQDKSGKSRGQCKKTSDKHALMPGLFTVYCEHGMCNSMSFILHILLSMSFIVNLDKGIEEKCDCFSDMTQKHGFVLRSL